MAFEYALVDIITRTKGVKEAFASMAKSIAADLARMARPAGHHHPTRHGT